jgi:translation initiation factor IF-2
MARQIEIPNPITVGELADTLEIPVTKLIGELFRGGIIATVNEKIDFDTASILVGDLDVEVELVEQEKNPNPHKKRVYN